MNAKRLIVLAAVLLVLGVLAWGAVQIVQRSGNAATVDTPATRVKRGSVAITVAATGELQGGNAEVLIAPQVAQDTLTITFIRNPGELVQPGDVVAEFDTTQQEYNLREAEADLAEAGQRVIQTESENAANEEESRYTLEAARNRVKLAEIECKKNSLLARLTARDNDMALEAARNRLRQAEQDIANRKTTGAAGLTIQKAAEARARSMAQTASTNIQNMTLKAKTGGYVSLQPDTYNTFYLSRGMSLPPVQIGSTVRPGMPVAQIPDMQSWEVVAMVSELDRGHLVVGQPVSVSVVALSGKAYSGRVKLLGSATGSNWDRKFECRIALDRPDPDLRPGMSSNLVITAQKLDNVLWVPSQALFETDGRSFVYLKNQTGFSTHDVALVKRSESQVVLTGVNEGDFVALSNPSEQNKPAQKAQSASKAVAK